MERPRKLGAVTARDRSLAAFVALLWGINFLALDYALRWFPPLFFAGLRFLVIAVPTGCSYRCPG